MENLLTIQEIARRSGVAASALRFYEERGLIRSQRSGAGHRRFPRAALRRIAFIVFADRAGLVAPLARLDLANRRAHCRARAPEGRTYGMHRLRLPIARALPVRQSRRPRGAPRARTALLDSGKA